MTGGFVDAPVYLQVEPDLTRYRRPGREPDVLGARVVGMTQKRPERPKPGTVVVKVTLRLPKAAFHPLRPEAVVTIPADLTDPQPVEVTAEDPR